MPKELRPLHTVVAAAIGSSSSVASTPASERALRSARRRLTRPSTPSTSSAPSSRAISVRSAARSDTGSASSKPSQPRLSATSSNSSSSAPESPSTPGSVADGAVSQGPKDDIPRTPSPAPLPMRSPDFVRSPVVSEQVVSTQFTAVPSHPIVPSSPSPTSSFSVTGPSLLSPTLDPVADQTTAANPRLPASVWTLADDRILQEARKAGINWKIIAERYFPNKTSNACRKRHERLVQRQASDSWDDARFDALAGAYVEQRKQIWTGLAEQLDEKWQCVEEKCMEKGLKFLLAHGQSVRSLPAGGDHGYGTGCGGGYGAHDDMSSDPISHQSDEGMLAHHGAAEVLAFALPATPKPTLITTAETRQTLAPIQSSARPESANRPDFSIRSLLRED